MDKSEVKNMLLQGIPVYKELSNNLICLNDISFVRRYDCLVENKPVVRYYIYLRHIEKTNPITITDEEYEILKKYLTII